MLCRCSFNGCDQIEVLLEGRQGWHKQIEAPVAHFKTDGGVGHIFQRERFITGIGCSQRLPRNILLPIRLMVIPQNRQRGKLTLFHERLTLFRSNPGQGIQRQTHPHRRITGNQVHLLAAEIPIGTFPALLQRLPA